MRAVLLGLMFVALWANAMAQQDSLALISLARPAQSKFSLLSSSQSSTNLAPSAAYTPIWLASPAFTYQQGKLPLFCALEDKLWRSTGLGIRFRITDAPIGAKP